MQLEGSIPTKCPPGQVVDLLNDPQVLARVAPAGCVIGEKTGDTVAFVIQRKVGPVALNLPGTMKVTQKPGSADCLMEVNASHLIGGRASVTLNLTPRRDAEGQQSLHWAGVLETHGLAAHLIEGRSAQVAKVLKNMFIGLRKRAEASS